MYARHAEMDAIKHLKIKNKKRLTLDLIVIRINNSGKLLLSMPCYNCIKQLRRLKNIKINKIHYSDENGNIISKRFVQLFNNSYKTKRFKNN